ncbi:hypothetical protein [Roseateles asaccharophilus]|uniref:Apolipoprotein N-acyltransferase n=1 Tax=Roseateles asaccharophilus TaxID=582607 RepID=A0ABU2A2B5_9BURK|nr:hypothetical protein [Roseateles asaccharophilus]MDR7331225.1 apolipoprotein N-acyltransferase [Roseateles asaccharophilus]
MSDDNQNPSKGDIGLKLGAGLMVGWFMAALLTLPALYWLFVAVYEAITAGAVRVTPTSRGEPRVWVPWPQAWSYLLGTSLIIAGGLPPILAFVAPRLRMGRTFLLLLTLSPFAGPLGIALWLFSGHLTSVRGALFLAGVFAFIAVTLWIGNRFGRAFVVLALLILVAFALYHFAPSL